MTIDRLPGDVQIVPIVGAETGRPSVRLRVTFADPERAIRIVKDLVLTVAEARAMGLALIATSQAAIDDAAIVAALAGMVVMMPGGTEYDVPTAAQVQEKAAYVLHLMRDGKIQIEAAEGW